MAISVSQAPKTERSFTFQKLSQNLIFHCLRRASVMIHHFETQTFQKLFQENIFTQNFREVIEQNLMNLLTGNCIIDRINWWNSRIHLASGSRAMCGSWLEQLGLPLWIRELQRDRTNGSARSTTFASTARINLSVAVADEVRSYTNDSSVGLQ